MCTPARTLGTASTPGLMVRRGMAGRVRYRVTVTREGRWWVAEVERFRSWYIQDIADASADDAFASVKEIL